MRPLVQEYQRAADKKQFRRKHEGTLILYEAAAKALKEQGFQKRPDLYALKNEYKQLAEQKDQMQRQYNDAKRQMQAVSYTHLDVYKRQASSACWECPITAFKKSSS